MAIADSFLDVITAERKALENLERLYRTNSAMNVQMIEAVAEAAGKVKSGGKIIISGVGKSGRIGQKIVSTLNSLSAQACFLHPTEALHGDLGVMDARRDIVLLISSSGKSPELQSLISHIDIEVPIIVISSHMSLSQCPLFAYSNGTHHTSTTTTATTTPIDGIDRIKLHLSACCQLSDEECINVAAPTVSTCAALTVGDAFAVAVGKAVHGHEQLREVFHKCHPGGDIGKRSRDREHSETELKTTAAAASPPPTEKHANNINGSTNNTNGYTNGNNNNHSNINNHPEKGVDATAQENWAQFHRNGKADAF